METVVFVAFGDELLSGLRSESNCSWLAARFHDAGWKVKAIEILEDSEEAIHEVFQRWVGSVGLLITSGGLGPTHDDRTRQSIASYLKCDLKADSITYDRIVDRYQGELRSIIERSRIPQGLVPELSEAIYNPAGSALGIKFSIAGTKVFSFPGIPAEYKAMAEQELATILQPKECWTSVHVVGWAESTLKENLSEVILQPGLHVSVLPSPNLIEIVIRGPAESIREAEVSIRTLLPSDCLPRGISTLEEAIMKAALSMKCVFSLAESCTGGFIGAQLTEIPGISEVFYGSAVCYSNSSKVSLLGVPQDLLSRYGAVSSECAAAMASGSRRIFDSDYAASVTGIAGPDGGTLDKPVGTVWFGISSIRGETTFHRILSGNRYMIRRRAKAIALELLWREILKCI